MKRVVILEAASADLEDARDLYNSQTHGVGDYCVDSLLTDIQSLTLLEGRPFRRYGCCRLLAKTFPYGIFYRETATQIQVFAIIHLHRSPSWIEQRINRRLSELN